MIVNEKPAELTNAILSMLNNACDEGHEITAQRMDHYGSPDTVHVHSEGWGPWFLFAGYCLPTALIQANNFQDAYDVYLDLHVPCDEPESEEDADHGYFGPGGWYSEVTTSYIVSLDYTHYDWTFTIKPGQDWE